MDEHEAPMLTVTLSTRERASVLIALWDYYLGQLSRRTAAAEARGPDSEQTATLLAFTAMQLDESLYDLVRKFGGDPAAHRFIPKTRPRQV